MVQQYAQANQEELASSGITVVEGDDGSVKLVDSDSVNAVEEAWSIVYSSLERKMI